MTSTDSKILRDGHLINMVANATHNRRRVAGVHGKSALGDGAQVWRGDRHEALRPMLGVMTLPAVPDAAVDGPLEDGSYCGPPR